MAKKKKDDSGSETTALAGDTPVEVDDVEIDEDDFDLDDDGGRLSFRVEPSNDCKVRNKKIRCRRGVKPTSVVALRDTNGDGIEDVEERRVEFRHENEKPEIDFSSLRGFEPFELKINFNNPNILTRGLESFNLKDLIKDDTTSWDDLEITFSKPSGIECNVVKADGTVNCNVPDGTAKKEYEIEVTAKDKEGKSNKDKFKVNVV